MKNNRESFIETLKIDVQIDSKNEGIKDSKTTWQSDLYTGHEDNAKSFRDSLAVKGNTNIPINSEDNKNNVNANTDDDDDVMDTTPQQDNVSAKDKPNRNNNHELEQKGENNENSLDKLLHQDPPKELQISDKEQEIDFNGLLHQETPKELQISDKEQEIDFNGLLHQEPSRETHLDEGKDSAAEEYQGDISNTEEGNHSPNVFSADHSSDGLEL